MARLTEMQRLARVLEFLTGLGHPEVRAALSGRGFSQAEAEEGFQLLCAASVAFHAAAAHPPAPRDTLTLLDSWENRWLPIVRATLERHFPKLARSVLLNIRQTRGPELLLTLPTLLDRIEALGASAREPERRAHGLLVRRGLTAEVVEQARALANESQRIAEPSAAPPSPTPPSTRKQAIDLLWSWYLDWSRSARSAIQDRRLLRVLGFSKP